MFCREVRVKLKRKWKLLFKSYFMRSYFVIILLLLSQLSNTLSQNNLDKKIASLNKVTPSLNTAPQQVIFNEVLPPEGKKFYQVKRIVQDKQGYMWFATMNGLFQYDGYQIISYKNDPISPGNNKLITVCADATGI